MRTLTLIVALLSALSFGSAQAQTAEENQARLQELQKSITELKERLQQVRNQRDGLKDDIRENESEIGDLLDKIESLKADIQDEQNKLGQLEDERKQLIGQQITAKKQVAQQVRAAYLLGKQSQLKLLLNQNNPQQVSRVMGYYDAILASQNQQLGGYADNLEQLAELEPRLQAKKNSLALQRQRLEQQYQALTEKQQQRRSMVSKLSESLKSGDAQLENLLIDEQRVQSLVSEIATVSRRRPPPAIGTAFAQRKGRLSWPADGRLLTRFGNNRIGGKMKWQGVTIAANEGSPVAAIHDGQVVFADYLRGYGLLIILDHGDNYLSLYAHNQALTRSLGENVRVGDIIAQVGNTGGQDQAGLYFEIRYQGEPINPASWCG